MVYITINICLARSTFEQGEGGLYRAIPTMTQSLVLYDFNRKTGPLSRQLRQAWGSIRIGIPTGKYQNENSTIVLRTIDPIFTKILQIYLPWRRDDSKTEKTITKNIVWYKNHLILLIVRSLIAVFVTALCHINILSWI